MTKAEIEEELKNAKKFEPKLRTFIFTTTAPKDVEIEKYVRIKDKESIDTGGFEIILYCWPDLVDLIEENKETFNWYVNQIQFKDQFDVLVTANSKENDLILRPKFLKTIKSFELRPKATATADKNLFLNPLVKMNLVIPIGFNGSKKVNHAWCSVETTISNTGSKVLEDWKLWLDFGNTVRKVDDDFTKDIFMYKQLSKYRTTWANEDNQVLFKPIENGPLIQKDVRTFTSYCIPIIGTNEIAINWHLLARDFDREGEIKFEVKPDYEIKNEVVTIDNLYKVKTKEEISEFIETVVPK